MKKAIFVGDIVGEWEILSRQKGGNGTVRCTLCGLESTRKIVKDRLKSKSCSTRPNARVCSAILDPSTGKRKYSLVETLCSNCGKVMLVQSNNHNHTSLCSKSCRNQWAANRQLEKRKESVEALLRMQLSQAKARAKKKGLEFDLDVAWMRDKLKEQNGCCAISGVKLKASKSPGRSKTHKHTATFDRIDPNKGYTKDNVQILTYIANVCKNAFTQEDVMEFAFSVVANNRLVGKEGTCP